jgi:quercetin dioxygenase-like cupin family protein
MNEQDFAAQLERDGFVEIETRTLAARPANHGHTHDSSVRGMVLDGEFIVACGSEAPRSYRAGEVFEVAAGVTHTEAIGAAGARIVVGRKY